MMEPNVNPLFREDEFYCIAEFLTPKEFCLLEQVSKECSYLANNLWKMKKFNTIENRTILSRLQSKIFFPKKKMLELATENALNVLFNLGSMNAAFSNPSIDYLKPIINKNIENIVETSIQQGVNIYSLFELRHICQWYASPMGKSLSCKKAKMALLECSLSTFERLDPLQKFSLNVQSDLFKKIDNDKKNLTNLDNKENKLIMSQLIVSLFINKKSFKKELQKNNSKDAEVNYRMMKLENKWNIMVTVYSEVCSLEELYNLAKWYKTDIGKQLAEKEAQNFKKQIL